MSSEHIEHGSLCVLLSRRVVVLVSLTIMFTLATAASASSDAQNVRGFSQRLASLQGQWLVAIYEREGNAQTQAIEHVLSEARQLQTGFPDRAEPLVLQGIILSKYAGIQGGIRGFDLIKQARVVLEQSLVIDPTSMDASAHARLGVIYRRVPDWPLGFGDKNIAHDHFQEALAIAPDGLDANYFYGEYLKEKGRHAEALWYFIRALAAVPPSHNQVAVRAQQQEIKLIIDELVEVLMKRAEEFGGPIQ